MPDFATSYFGGLEAGQRQLAAQRADEAASQEQDLRSLQTLVLKHQLDRNKILDAHDDYVKQHGAEEEHFNALQGQPAANIPSTPVTTQEPNPAKNLSGMISGLVHARLSGNMASPTGTEPGPGASPASPDQSAGSPDQPSFTPAPAAQAATVPVTRMAPTPVAFSGYGTSPGYTRTPQTLEQVVAARTAEKMADPYSLHEGEGRYVGGTKIAEGPEKTDIIPAGATAVKGSTVVARGGPRVAPVPDPATIAYQNKRLGIEGARLAGAEADRAAARGDKKTQEQTTNDLRQWSTEVSQGHQKQANDLKVWSANPMNAMAGPDAKPAPEYTPPTFDAWQAGRHATAAAVATAHATTGAAPPGKPGQTLPIPGKPGQEMTFQKTKSGAMGWVRTK